MGDYADVLENSIAKFINLKLFLANENIRSRSKNKIFFSFTLPSLPLPPKSNHISCLSNKLQRARFYHRF